MGVEFPIFLLIFERAL